MSDEEKSSFIGKYVCYNAIDGGACWGRIKSECVVNTIDGEVEAFILENRLVAYQRAASGFTAKVMSPGIKTPLRTVTLDPNTGQIGTDTTLEIRRCKGDTIIRKDVIDLKRDVLDLADVIVSLSDEDVFLALLNPDGISANGNKAMAMGLSQLAEKEEIEGIMKRELRKRIENRQ